MLKSNIIAALCLLIVPVSVLVYFVFRKKENPLSQCSSCDGMFDQETIDKAQRSV